MTVNPNRYAKAADVACPSCGYPHKITDTGTYIRDCLNNLDKYGLVVGTIGSYEWQKQQHPDKEPIACEAQFFVDAHVQIVARVSPVQWEGEG